MSLNTNTGPERVQVFPESLSPIAIAGAGISTAAMLIKTSLSGAPEQTATPVTSLAEFVELFGSPDDTEAYYHVKGFFDNAGTGNTLYIVNVGSSPAEADYIGSQADSTGFYALDNIDVIGLIMAPGLPIEMAGSVQKALITYCDTIRTEFGATLSTSMALLSPPVEIMKPVADETLVTAQFLSVSGSGPWTLSLQIEDTAVAASGTVTISDFANLVSGTADTIQIGATIFTAQAGAASPGDPTFQAAVDNDTTAESLADQINAHAVAGALVEAVAAGSIVTITALTAGASGNSIQLIYTDNDANIGAAVSGAVLAGGANGNADLSDIKPGMIVTNSAGSYKGIISAVDNTLDTLVVTPNPTTFFTLGADVLVKMPSAITWKETVIAQPAKEAAWFFNPAFVTDFSETPDPSGLVLIDPIGHVAGMIARIDANTSIGGPSHAPAGLQYAQLAGIESLAVVISEKNHGGPLRLAFINRLTSFAGTGPISFGGYTADAATPTFSADDQLIQVIRTIMFIKASLEPGLRPFIWENYSPATQDQVVQAIESFLRNNSHLFPKGLPESQKFRVVSVEPTVDQLNQGLLIVKVQIKPNKAIRFIEVDLEYPLP